MKKSIFIVVITAFYSVSCASAKFNVSKKGKRQSATSVIGEVDPPPPAPQVQEGIPTD